MLRATVLTANLKNAISFTSHGVSSRSQLPILLNFLIEAKNGSLFFSSTDLEIGIKVKIPAKVEKEGEITVSAKTFLDLVGSIEQEKTEIFLEGTVLHLKAEGLRTSFPTLPAGEFPKLYETKGEKTAEFKKEEFDREVSKIVFAASSDIGRPALSGILVKTQEGGGLSLVATDGYRLSLLENSEKEDGGLGKNLLVPARVIKEVLGTSGKEQKIELFTSPKNNQVLFEIGGVVLVGRLIEAEYPDYQKIIPQDFGTRAIFDRMVAQNAVRACSVFAREAANIVKLSVLKNKVVFSASASSVGENEVEVDAKTTGEENEIAFNARYLLEFFGNIDEDSVIFEMTGPLNPGVFKLEKDPLYLHLIMPIRVTD